MANGVHTFNSLFFQDNLGKPAPEKGKGTQFNYSI